MAALVHGAMLERAGESRDLVHVTDWVPTLVSRHTTLGCLYMLLNKRAKLFFF